MNDRTRRQLHALSLAFYAHHADAFDASRDGLPWPGWDRVVDTLAGTDLRVLDIGCGNGRFALDLAGRDTIADRGFDYIGTDANEALLEAARRRAGEALGTRGAFDVHDFLATEPAGCDLPAGPFSLVVLFGVLHHVPGRDTRLALLRSAASRLGPGGVLAVTAWQFAGRARFEKRRVAWDAVGPVEGGPIDPGELEAGDALLRFGDDPTAPPRYCHQLDDDEFEGWADALGLDSLDDFHADGAEGDLNRYWIARAPAI